MADAQQHLRRDALNRSATAAEDAVQLVQARYTTGLTDFRSVLEAAPPLPAAVRARREQDVLAEREGNVMINLIRL